MNDLLQNIVKKVFLIVFPPWGEEPTQIDIRLGIVTEKYYNLLYVIGTSMEDLWSTTLSIEEIPTIYFDYSEYDYRMNKWRACEMNSDFVLEYYDFTKSPFFQTIVNHKIRNIQLLSIADNPNPFGIKLLFQDDFILSTPVADGNTIETKAFNALNKNIEHFYYFGEIIYSNI